LLLPKNSDGLKIQSFVSPWGETNELLCSFEGTLIGQVSSDDRFPETIKIILLPKLDRGRNYPFPSPHGFVQALLRLLRNSPQLRLICERDADQETVRRLATLDLVEVDLERVIAYCEGQILDCPTFSFSRP
jgi:hypothetical protein